MAYSTFIDDHSNTYSEPYIPDKIVGFHGIDPDLVSAGVNTISSSGEKVMHELLTDLLGGSASGHYHLTHDELAKLGKIIAALIPAGRTDVVLPSAGIDNHEALRNLLGGSSTGHYHLTQDELNRLGKLLSTLIPVGETEVRVPTTVLPSGGTDNHEALTNIQGGIVNTDGTTEHYHFTEDEWTRLKTLLSTTFPPGSVAPKFPTGPTTPAADDDPEGDGDLSADAGLPPTDPPEWGASALPKKHAFYEGAGNMYYGTIADGTKPYFRTALVLPMIYNDSKTAVRVNSTVDLNAWDSVKDSLTVKSYGKTLADCLYVDWNEETLDKNTNRKLYYITYSSTQKNVNRKGSGGNGYQSLAKAQGLVAACVSADKNVEIFITDSGDVSRITRTLKVAKSGKKKGQVTGVTLTVDKSVHSCKVKANMGCAIWIPAYNCFCVSGKDGVAVSGTGETWTKKAGDGTNAPIDLRGLTYRADIEYVDNGGQKYTGCAFGWSADDKTFWKSYDGQHWMRHNIKPIPLKEIKSVAYSPETGMYCAAGTPKSDDGGLYVYFSKNLAGWTKVKVSIDDLTAESIIWMANTGKFVLMPSSGSYLYTFKAADWK